MPPLLDHISLIDSILHRKESTERDRRYEMDESPEVYSEIEILREYASEDTEKKHCTEREDRGLNNRESNEQHISIESS